MLTLSLIIPVYNEERHIEACLEAVARQSVMPDEVIVVDNNSTDNTAKLAKKFKFVRVVSEKKQGLIPARDRGFKEAKGQILGRIDADSIIHEDWCERVKIAFSNEKDLQGLTGLARTYYLPMVASTRSTYPSRMYFWMIEGFLGINVMWGANMALRKSAWKKIEKDVHHDDKSVHEDQDISINMAAKGLKVSRINDIQITTEGQIYLYLPNMLYYFRLRNETKRHHIENGNLSSPKLLKKTGSFDKFKYTVARAVVVYAHVASVLILPVYHVLYKQGKIR